MEAGDMIKLPSPSHFGSGSESGEICDSGSSGPNEADSQPNNCEAKHDKIEGEIIELDGNLWSHVVETEQCHTSADGSSLQQLSVEMTETIRVREKLIGLHSETDTVEEKLDNSNSRMQADDLLIAQNGIPIQNTMMDDISTSDIKNVRMTNDDQQPSVHVMYSSLTRASKRKLEEVLQQWLKWQAEHDSLDENKVIESGEETYFPALRVGTEKTSAVSFWIDNQTSNKHDKGFIPLDGQTLPLYDRHYALGLASADGSSNLEGGLEIIRDASRCFNCGSYSHSMKQCPKPRDNAAVIKARKEHNFKKNQSAISHKLIRYYQNSRGGKFDDLKPGSLAGETRQLLGLGVMLGKTNLLSMEFDPPPWLNRMREIGYPPGYLALDDEDQPSGITIYGDGVIDDGGQKNGEISEMKDDTVESEHPNKQGKMSIEFPGINAPIPEEADARHWAPPAPSSSDPSWSKSPQRSNLYSQHGGGGYHHEQRWCGNFRDDGPPGVDPGYSLPVSYTPRYSSYMVQSPTLTRSESECE